MSCGYSPARSGTRPVQRPLRRRLPCSCGDLYSAISAAAAAVVLDPRRRNRHPHGSPCSRGKCASVTTARQASAWTLGPQPQQKYGDLAPASSTACAACYATSSPAEHLSTCPRPRPPPCYAPSGPPPPPPSPPGPAHRPAAHRHPAPRQRRPYPRPDQKTTAVDGTGPRARQAARSDTARSHLDQDRRRSTRSHPTGSRTSFTRH